MKIIRPVEIGDGATFSRASAATYFDKEGVLQTAGVDEPRWGHEYVDGRWAETGLLIEGEATNVVRRSQDLSLSEWIVSGLAYRFPGQSGGLGGDTLTRLVEDGVLQHHHITQALGSIPSGSQISISFTLRFSEGVSRYLGLFLTGAAEASIGSALRVMPDGTMFTNSSALEWQEAKALPNGSYRVRLVTKLVTSTVSPTLYLRLGQLSDFSGAPYPGDLTSNLLVGEVQVEVGSFPTSYIPTEGSQVTRAPDLITGTGLVTTNVPENDYPEWSAGTLDKGDRRILAAQHKVYEVLAEQTTDAPLDGLAKEVPTWMEVGPTNLWRAFDDKVGTATENPEEIRYSLMPSAGVDAIALFGVDAGGVQVIVTDPRRGEIFNSRTVPVLTDGIETWWDYFFQPIELRRDFVVSGLGGTKYCRIDIIIKKEGGTAKVGAIVMGKLADLGLALFGTSVGISDYSRKERDTFGNTIVVERGFSKTADFQVAVETRDVGRVQRTLAQYRARPLVWIGADDLEETLVYGFYREFDIVISGPVISDANISVEGLV